MYQGGADFIPGGSLGDGLRQIPGFTLEERGAGLYRLDVCGDFSPGWLARLSEGLSGRHVSIERGEGRRIRASRWQAVFDIVMGPEAGDLRKIDWQELIDRGEQTAGPGRLELSAYRLRPQEGADGLWVEVEGPDKIGFLQHLLKGFALFSLFPSELQVETIGRRARDRFVLRGIAGSPASPQAIQGLRDLFDAALLG